jgi:hypothetical protein
MDLPAFSSHATFRQVVVVLAGIATAVTLAVIWASGGSAAQRAARGGIAVGDPAATLWTMATPLDDGRQMLLVVDQQNRALAIYHVDPATGTLVLKSTRDIRWDLLVEDFNAQEPKPSSLKKMLEMPK